jgi:lipoyl-dependent peroxiredoxin
MTLKVLYTTTATATGGRNGHTRNADGVVSVDLSIPKSMGGAGKAGATTPEDLFACGYAACFGSACDFAAKSSGCSRRASASTARSALARSRRVASG